jgi:hypothetical protein
MHKATLVGLGSILTLASIAGAQQTTQSTSVITVGNEEFPSWQAYVQSAEFKAMSLRCGTPDVDLTSISGGDAPGDCAGGSTTPRPQYAPGNGRIRIPVVVHIIQHSNGAGNIPDSQVDNQIDILNEDFQALAGSNGGNGSDANIEFFLADRDPQGNPTTGITRSTNNTWFNDGGQYYNTLAWDTNEYLNIYTNAAGGALGYVPTLPQFGIVGSKADRVVILWSSFGRNAPIGPPYNQGRTTTHEVGHYLGLYHTFQGGCAAASNCYNNGDVICDTNPDGTSHFGCPNTNSCSSPDPVDNYMEYTDDLCMERFTAEQINRMRCTIEEYRPDLPGAPAVCLSANVSKRNGGSNPDVYVASAPIIGQNVDFTVDTQGFNFATIYGVLTSANRILDNGNVVLIEIDSALQFVIGPLNGPVAQASQVIANDPSVCGLTIYSQAKLHNAARRPFTLTNSQDLRIGN